MIHIKLTHETENLILELKNTLNRLIPKLCNMNEMLTEKTTGEPMV